ncbi:MAG: FG-GAP-like repeat-containing protein, partial [bacterium]
TVEIAANKYSTLAVSLLNDPQKIFTDGDTVDHKGENLNYIVPFVIDWNNDKKRDLIIGAENGNVYLHKNSGINENPVFSFPEELRANDFRINVGGFSVPFVVDWNNDNKKDFIAGSLDGNIYLYINVGEDNNPLFNDTTGIIQGKPIIANGNNINVGNDSSPFVADWNDDHMKDLLIGAGDGNIYLYLNTGMDESPQFNNTAEITQGRAIKAHEGIDLNVGSYAKPFVVDWKNNDGIEDLIVGSGDGNVYYYFNHGTETVPIFSESKREKIQNLVGDINVTGYSAPFVIDWNMDKSLDLIIGNLHGNLYLYQSEPGQHPLQDCDLNNSNGQRVIDGEDLIEIQWSFGSEPGSPNWNSAVDFDDNLVINGNDLIDIFSINFGKSY